MEIKRGNYDIEQSLASGDGINAGAITQEKTNFLSLNSLINLYNGDYLLDTGIDFGTNKLIPNVGRQVGKVLVEPNTTYSITKAVATDVFLIKSANSTNFAIGDTFDGSISVSTSGATLHRQFTTGANDRIVFFQFTTSNQNIYSEVSKGTRTNAADTNYNYDTININKNRPIIFKKTANVFDIYIPSHKSTNYLHYDYRLITNVPANANLWKVYTMDIVDKSLTVIKSTFVDMEWEGVLKETGASDFIGGYHGDENLVSLNVMVDGKELDLTQTHITLFAKKEVKIVNKSILSSFFNSATDAFSRIKISTWNHDNYIVSNIWESLILQELTISYVTMMSLPRQIGGVDFVNWVRSDFDYVKTDVNTAAPEGAMLAVNGATYYELWGTSSGVYAKVECVADFATWNTYESFATNAQENIIKVYFDLTNPAHTFSVGEKLKSKSIYTIVI